MTLVAAIAAVATIQVEIGGQANIVRWDELEPDPRLCGSGHFLHPSCQSAIPETLAVGSLFWFQCWMESVWIGAHDDDAATSLVADATHSWYTALGALAGQMLFLPTSL